MSPTVKVGKLAVYLNKVYPNITSLVDVEYEKFLMQWRSYLINKGLSLNTHGRLSSSHYEPLVNQLYLFLQNFYDDREEFEKDIWDVRRIPGAKFTDNKADYLFTFLDIPLPFRQLAKRYLKVRIGTCCFGQCSHDLMSLRLFFNCIHKIHLKWQDLKLLTRKDMEEYLSWFRSYTVGYTKMHVAYFISLRMFLEYIQRAEYFEAPEKPSACLIFKEDMPRRLNKTENDIKYIPEGVLQQLEDNLEHLRPSEYIPEVVLLRAAGWRISDNLNLRYDKCLERTAQGWWLCGDIPKTGVLNHRVPITDEVAAVVQAVIDDVKEKSTPENNPRRLHWCSVKARNSH
jgi:integrase